MSRRRTLFSNTDSDSDVEAVLRTSRRGRPRKLQKSSGFGATRRPSSSSAYGSHQDQSVGEKTCSAAIRRTVLVFYCRPAFATVSGFKLRERKTGIAREFS
uniref:ORF3 n=1 Tax=Macrostomum lignano TaxID=282301 RepID=A0A1I8IG70_9PLAT